MKTIITTLETNSLQIKKDLETLSSMVEIPGNPDIEFSITQELRRNDTAVTHYSHEMVNGTSPIVEFPEICFKENERIRLIMLLHELIHAYQRPAILRNWNQTTIDKIREYTSVTTALIPETRDTNSPQYQIFLNKLSLVKGFYEWIFEMWDDLCMKNDYNQFFKDEMTHIHRRISSGTTTGEYDNWDSRFAFNVFREILRASYLRKITDGYSIQTQFNNLKTFWLSKLQQIASSTKFDTLMQLEPRLTNVELYPQSSDLEDAYVKLSDGFWYDRIN